MAAIRDEDSDQLLVMFNQYNKSITNALEIAANDINSPEAKRQQDQKIEDELLFEILLECIRNNKKIQLQLLAIQEQQNEKESDKKRKHLNHLAEIAYELEEEEEIEALAKLHKELSENERQQLEKMKHDIEQAMKEHNEQMEENQKFISYISKRLEETKIEFLNNYSENMKMQLLQHFHHEDGHIKFKIDEHETVSIHVDQIIDALRQAAEEEYRKLSNNHQAADHDNLRQNIHKKMEDLFGAHFAKHPESARFTQQVIENVTKDVSRVVLDKGGAALQKALDVACIGQQQLAYAQSKQKHLAACKQAIKTTQQKAQKPDAHPEKIKDNVAQALSLAARSGQSKGAEANQEQRKFSKFEALAKKLAAQQAQAAQANRPALDAKAEHRTQLR